MIIEGIVVHGKHLGRTLGFPTANLDPLSPPERIDEGVYAAWLIADGRRMGCMVNIGSHPTLPDGGKTIEAHIFDFQGDLYGQRVRLETIAHLRGEIRFASIEALRRQLASDAKAARAILNI